MSIISIIALLLSGIIMTWASMRVAAVVLKAVGSELPLPQLEDWLCAIIISGFLLVVGQPSGSVISLLVAALMVLRRITSPTAKWVYSTIAALFAAYGLYLQVPPNMLIFSMPGLFSGAFYLGAAACFAGLLWLFVDSATPDISARASLSIAASAAALVAVAMLHINSLSANSFFGAVVLGPMIMLCVLMGLGFAHKSLPEMGTLSYTLCLLVLLFNIALMVAKGAFPALIALAPLLLLPAAIFNPRRAAL